MFQKDTTCTRLEYCRHLHKLCVHNSCPQRWRPDFVFERAGRRSLSPGWLCYSQKWGTSSQILARRHTQLNTHPYSQMKCTQIKQRQYHLDWRSMHHSHTHTTRNRNTRYIQHSSTSPTKHHPPIHKQQSTNGQKNRHTSNQHKRHQKQNRGTIKSRTQHATRHHHNIRNKTHTKS